MKLSNGSETILRAVLAVGAVTLAGCGGGVDRTVVVHEPAPVQQAETETVVEEPEVVIDGNGEGPEEGTVVRRVVEEEQAPTVVHIQIEREYFARHPHHHRLQGPALVNFNTGYLDGWAGAEVFNHGQPLDDAQVERLIEVGRRQGDPTGKLALVGYQEGYRAGARHEGNPYQRRMTHEQSARFRSIRGLPATGTSLEVAQQPGGRTEVKNETFVRPRAGETEEARRARLEASKNNLEAARANREAEQKRLEAEEKKLQTARLEKEAARKAKLEAAKDEREQRELALKSKLEAEKKHRETERQQRELALKSKLEAEKKQREEQRKQQALARQEKEAAREADEQADKQERDAKRDQRHAAVDKRQADRKQKLAEKKAEREAKKTQTADTSDAAH